MITDEQIKNLKPGDPIVIHTTVDKIDADGDLWFHCPQVNDNNWREYINPKFVSLPGETMEKSKYDPCRKFREGDEVRIIEKDGRTVHDPLNGGIWRVARNERTGGAHEMSVLVNLIYEDEKIAWQISVPFCFLELVTPVEELEPYRVVRPENYQCIRIMKEKRIHSSIPFDEEECVCRTLEEAKAAAEAECARLTAEYRKGKK